MSLDAVRVALEEMERWTADPGWEPDADELAEWHSAFQAAAAEAKKGTGWQELSGRAHAAGQRLEALAEAMSHRRDALKAELSMQGVGNRALKGYGASSRMV